MSKKQPRPEQPVQPEHDPDDEPFVIPEIDDEPDPEVRAYLRELENNPELLEKMRRKQAMWF